MRILRFFPSLVFVAAFTIPGCLRSLHPLYTEKTLVFEQTLIGTWVDQDSSVWTFAQSGQKAYDLIYTEKGSPGRFEARLVKLGKLTFLDLSLIHI